MTISELRNLFDNISETLTNYNLDEHFTEEIIDEIVDIETLLFRARIKLQRELNK